MAETPSSAPVALRTRELGLTWFPLILLASFLTLASAIMVVVYAIFRLKSFFGNGPFGLSWWGPLATVLSFVAIVLHAFVLQRRRAQIRRERLHPGGSVQMYLKRGSKVAQGNFLLGNLPDRLQQLLSPMARPIGDFFAGIGRTISASLAGIVLIASVVTLIVPLHKPIPSWAFFKVSSAATSGYITNGPDGNLWFTAANAFTTVIGRITTSGVITEFTHLNTASGDPQGITSGPDGNLWFTEKDHIGRVTPQGGFTEFLIPTPGSFPVGITSGPDGNLWFTESNANKIGRITTAGVITEFTVPRIYSSVYGTVEPTNIALGPDGDLWFTDKFSGTIGQVTRTGDITLHAEPGGPPTGSEGTFGITGGPDGNVWFTGHVADHIGQITPSGTIKEFLTPTQPSDAGAITTGRDGNLWFTEDRSTAHHIGRITPAGAITEYAIPGSMTDGAYAITTGADGNLWFVEENGDTIVRLS